MRPYPIILMLMAISLTACAANSSHVANSYDINRELLDTAERGSKAAQRQGSIAQPVRAPRRRDNTQVFVGSKEPSQTDRAYYITRDNCLRTEIERLIHEKGDELIVLDEIVVSTTSACSNEVRRHLLDSADDPRNGDELVRSDQLQTERHAFTMALELKEKLEHK